MNDPLRMATFFTSQKKSKLHAPPSRPIPELRAPPKGAASSRMKKQLTHTVPATMRAARSEARRSLRVKMVAARP
jgi:hypothetical protein